MADNHDHLRIRESDGHREVFDPARRRWVALTPEEWVRQHTLLMLHEGYGYPWELMRVEGAITVGSLTKRCDIVVYGSDVTPRMVVECKQEEVAITQRVVDQACRYNTVLRVPFLLLTNGRTLLCLRKFGQSLQQVALPRWEELNATDFPKGQ